MDNLLIDVVYCDGTESAVSNDVLDVLIATAKIRRFRRHEGWVDIIRGDACLRDYKTMAGYHGPERRLPWPDEKEA